MNITINFGNTDQMEIMRLANELHVDKKVILTKLKNIYLANFQEDLKWIEEMILQDGEENV